MAAAAHPLLGVLLLYSIRKGAMTPAITVEGGHACESVPLIDVSDRLEREIDHLERLRSRTENSSTPVSGTRAVQLLPHEIRRELLFLRQLSAGLACGNPGPIWHDRVGYGTVLLARDMNTGTERFYKIVMHRLNPLDLAQVSLSSDVGRALHGSRRQDELEVVDRYGRTRLRLLTLKTLPQRLGMPDPEIGEDRRRYPSFGGAEVIMPYG